MSDLVHRIKTSLEPILDLVDPRERISLGKLISASKLPASDSSERRLVLDASSSMSPPRGSMTGFIQGIQPLANMAAWCSSV
jgi:hypothetical protein